MRIKSDKQVLLSCPVSNFVYEDFNGNKYMVHNGEVRMPRTIALTALRISSNFTYVGEDWEWESTENKIYDCSLTNGLSRRSKVLLMRGGGLGDLLLITPLIRELNKRNCVVTLATNINYFGLFQPQTVTLVDQDDYPYKLPIDDYDAIIDLNFVPESVEANNPNIAHRTQLFADCAKIDLQGNYKIDINTSHITQAQAPGLSIYYVRDSTCSNRNLTQAKHDQIIKRLRESGYTVQENEPTDLLTLISFIHYADLVITPDTGVFHIAQALNVPTVTYFGAFPLELRVTNPKIVHDMHTNKCAVMPCKQYSCPFSTPDNPISPCIDLHVEQIVGKVFEVLPIL